MYYWITNPPWIELCASFYVEGPLHSNSMAAPFPLTTPSPPPLPPSTSCYYMQIFICLNILTVICGTSCCTSYRTALSWRQQDMRGCLWEACLPYSLIKSGLNHFSIYNTHDAAFQISRLPKRLHLWWV